MDDKSPEAEENTIPIETPELRGVMDKPGVTEGQKAIRREEIEGRVTQYKVHASEPPEVAENISSQMIQNAAEQARQGILDSTTVESIADQLRQIPKAVAPKEQLMEPPTREQIDEVREALRAGFFKPADKAFTVVRGTVYNGIESLVLLDPDNKQEFTYTPGIKEPVFLYTVADPEPADLVSADTARDWLEKKLKPVEARGRLIDPIFESSLLATIQQKVPDTITPGLSEELEIRARARIRYHDASLKAQFYLGDFGDEFWKILHEEHKEILQTPGVRTAMQQMIAGEGGYFRLRDYTDPATGIVHNDYTNARNALITHLQTPAGGGLNAEKAKLAVLLAEETAHIFGASSYYDGIRVKNTVATYADPAGPPGTTIPWATPDRFVNVNFLQSLYPNPGLTDEDRYARFFEEHYDDIDSNTSLSAQGALYMRRIFYLPISFEKTITVNKGKAKYLRRFAYEWVNSADRFTAGGPYTARTDIIAQIDNLIAGSGDMGKLFTWSWRVSEADKSRGQFADKGSESILNAPFILPNQVTEDNSSQTLPVVMDNYKKVSVAYGHLSENEREKAMAHLLTGDLTYVNSQEARNDGFNYFRWSHKIRFDAILWAINERLIDRKMITQIQRALQISENIATLQAGQSQLGEAAGGLLSGILKGIFRR